MIVLRWYAAFGREKRASVLHAAPLNPHPQPVQVLGADTYKIPVVPVLNPGRLPFAACEYVHALAAMHGLPVLAKCPIDPQLAACSDAGMIEAYPGQYLEGAADACEKLLKK